MIEIFENKKLIGYVAKSKQGHWRAFDKTMDVYGFLFDTKKSAINYLKLMK